MELVNWLFTKLAQVIMGLQCKNGAQLSSFTIYDLERNNENISQWLIRDVRERQEGLFRIGVIMDMYKEMNIASDLATFEQHQLKS